MAAPAYGAILLSIGLAVLAPSVLRGLLRRLERPLTVRLAAGGYLAALNLRHRAAELSGVLMPLTLFTGIATGSLGHETS
jgi:putative ABC transport system permease protein